MTGATDRIAIDGLPHLPSGRDQARSRAQGHLEPADQRSGHQPELDAANPSVHNSFPSSGLKECTLKQGPYDILYAAS
jgi:hypothetical protein